MSKHNGFIRKRNNDPSNIKQLTIREVTASTRHLIPPFEEVHFEFFSLSQSALISNGDFTKQQFHEMIQRIETFADESTRTLDIYPKEPILKAIVSEFGDRHSMKLQIERTQLTNRFAEIGGTPMHFDNGRYFVLWIPLTSSLIDNLCLGVGDIRKSKLRNRWIPEHIEPSTPEEDLPEVVWYQHMTMTSEDWIFLRGEKVPHYAADLGDDLKTQRRLNIKVNMEIDD